MFFLKWHENSCAGTFWHENFYMDLLKFIFAAACLFSYSMLQHLPLVASTGIAEVQLMFKFIFRWWRE